MGETPPYPIPEPYTPRKGFAAMRMTVPDVVITAENPFQGDILARKPFAEALLSLVQRINEPLVIALDALWGEGKTTFIRMWQQLLTEAGGQSIYIDTFATDALDSPFTVLTGEIASFCEQHEDARLLKELTDAAALAFTATLPFTDKIAGRCERDLVGLFRHEIQHYQTHKNNIQGFRTVLEILAASIRKSTGFPLVVVVDELDRCKPHYAIHLIELVKHIFANRNIVFILSINKKQLLSSVNHYYGLKDESNDYFNKFIGLELTLPSTTTLGDIDYYRNYAESSLQRLEIPVSGTLLNRLAELAAAETLPPRKLNSIATHLAIFALTHPDTTEAEAGLADVALLALLKVCRPGIYEMYRHGARERSEIQAVRELDWPPAHKETLLGWAGDVRIKTLCAYMDAFHMPPEGGKGRG
jgi:hypothetical protein